MNIFLCGYMGVGKSSIAKKLAEAVNAPFIDIDTLIEQQCNLPIHAVFNEKGEAYFRQKEADVLVEVIENNRHSIIALGGGVLTDDKNYDAIHANGTLIYLEAAPESLLKRIKKDTTKRPLLEKYKDDKELLDFIQSHLNDRLKNYQKADITIHTDNKSTDEIVEELLVNTPIKSN